MAKKITKKRKDVSINDLARMVAKGFENSVSKEAFQEFRNEFTDYKKETNLAFFNLDTKVQNIDTRLKKMEEVIEPFITGYRIMQDEVRQLISRINRLEKKAGIAK